MVVVGPEVEGGKNTGAATAEGPVSGEGRKDATEVTGGVADDERGAVSALGASAKGPNGFGVMAESGVGGAEFKFVATSKEAG